MTAFDWKGTLVLYSGAFNQNARYIFSI